MAGMENDHRSERKGTIMGRRGHAPPDPTVAISASCALKCNIPHFARWGMLRFVLYKAESVTLLSGSGAVFVAKR